MIWRAIEAPEPPMTTRHPLRGMRAAPPPDWQASVPSNRVIRYRERRTCPPRIEAPRREW